MQHMKDALIRYALCLVCALFTYVGFMVAGGPLDFWSNVFMVVVLFCVYVGIVDGIPPANKSDDHL